MRHCRRAARNSSTAPAPATTLKLYDGHFPDLLADIGKETVMADIKAWIAARLPAG